MQAALLISLGICNSSFDLTLMSYLWGAQLTQSQSMILLVVALMDPFRGQKLLEIIREGSSIFH